MRDFIKSKKQNNFTIKGVQVFIKDSSREIQDLKVPISSALNKVPEHLLVNLDTIYFGSFEHLEKLDLQAMYMNSSIFISSEIEEESEIVDDLVHEIAHSIEEIHKDKIYFDGEIEREFILKRKSLWNLLKQKGLNADLSRFLETEYNQEFDEFLYLEIGYPVLSIYSSSLFYSPYAVTSLREYFANGFEAFFMKEDVARLQKLSPALFKKIVLLSDLEEENQFY
jgi:hypothetical protein